MLRFWTRFFSPSLSLSLTLAACIAAAPHRSSALAAEVTWSGNSFPSNWTNVGNWVGGVAPANGDSLLFTGSNGAANSNDLPFFGSGINDLLTGITYAAGATAFTTTGNPLNVSGTISNLGTQNQTLNIGLRLNPVSGSGTRTTFTVANSGNIVLPNANQAWDQFYVEGTGSGGVVLSGSLIGTGGPGSNIQRLQVGGAATDGKLTVQGSAGATEFYVTGANGNAAEFIVDGGTFQSQNSFDIGGNRSTFTDPAIPEGNGAFSVINGGSVTASSSTFSVGGSGVGTLSTMLVDGAGSTVTASSVTSRTFLGFRGNADVTISNNATVSLGRDFENTTNIVGGTGITTLSILSGGSLTYNGITYFGGGTTFQGPLSGGTATVVVDGAGSTLTLGNAASTKFIGFDGQGSLTVRAGGLATFGGPVVLGNTAGSTGTVTLAGGALAATTMTLGNSAGSSGTVNFGEGTAATGSFTGAISSGSGTGVVNFNSTPAQSTAGNLEGGGLSVVHLGNSTTTLSGTNTFGGGVSLTAGTLNAGSATALGTSGTISFSGGTLQYSAGNQADYSGRFSSAAGQVYRVDTNGQEVTYAANLTSSGGSLTKLGTGTLVLTGENTYAGGTTVSAGTLRGTTAGLQGAIANASVVEFSQSSSGTYSGVISGAGSVVKSGSGAVALAGNNAFAGTTSIVAGLLAINGDQSGAAGLTTVSAGATLAGTGTIGGNVTVSGIHAPGNSPGVQTINGNLTYQAGASVEWELYANTTGGSGNFDQILLPTGDLAFSGATTLNLMFDGPSSLVDWDDSFWAVDRNWLLYDLSGGTTTGVGNFSISVADWLDGDDVALSASSRAGATFTVAQVGQDVTINYVAPVPEPAALTLAAIAGLGGLGLLRRKARRRRPAS